MVIHDYIAYPFTVQLARSLAERGHNIVYIARERGSSVPWVRRTCAALISRR